MSTPSDPPDTPDLDEIRADVAEAEERWVDRDEDLYGLLSVAGKLIGHTRTLLAEVQRLTGELATVTGQRDDALQVVADLSARTKP